MGVNGARRIRRRVPPGRTGRIALCVRTRIDSSIAEFGSRHRASSSRWKRLGHEARRGSARRAPLQTSRPKGMWRLFHPKPRYGRVPCPLTRVARVEVRRASSYSGGRTPAVCVRVHQAKVSLTTPLILDQEAGVSSPVGPSMPEMPMVGVRTPSWVLPTARPDTQPLRAVTDPLMPHAEMASKPP